MLTRTGTRVSPGGITLSELCQAQGTKGGRADADEVPGALKPVATGGLSAGLVGGREVAV